MNLSNAKVLITGGSSGIGAETARLFVSKGAKVAIAGRNGARLQAVATETGAVPIIADVTDPSDVARMTEETIAALGGYNVLINNAGYGYMAPLADIDPAQFEAVWRTNVYGAMLSAQAAARYFIAQKTGNIINIASTAGLNGSASVSPYNATKFALRGMTEGWRQELRPHNIRVTLINPSEVMTEFANNRTSNQGAAEKTYTAAEQATKLRASEIAHAIASVLEMDDRGFVTELTVFATNPQV